MTGSGSPDGNPAGLLNDLYHRSDAYSQTQAYLDTIRFVSEFKSQGPYNAYLLHRQNPRVSFAASAQDWESKYRVTLKTNARPLVILIPFGPVRFVYDIEDVEGDLPQGILNPFPATGIVTGATWANTVRNAEAHNIGVRFVPLSRQSAGNVERLVALSMMPTALKLPNQQNLFQGPNGSPPDTVKAQFAVNINDQFDQAQRYITLIHELAHVACGHLGQTRRADGRFHPWLDRRGLPHEVVELEAESVAYIVGRRAGVEARSETYLADHVDALKMSREAKRFSFDVVLNAANRLDSWGRRPPRKATK